MASFPRKPSVSRAVGTTVFASSWTKWKNSSMARPSDLSNAVTRLYELELAHVKIVGGYPPVIQRVGSRHIAVAGLDHDGEPELEVYTNAQFIRHVRSAERT